MKIYRVLFFVIPVLMAGLTSCKNKTQQQALQSTEMEEPEKPDFFPVTNYIKGQINQITTNPLKFTTVKGKTDSIWVKSEDFQKVFAEFLTPEIDSIHMAPFYKETKFADKTIGTYTFTYEPKGTLPDDLTLQRWDVYVDFKNNMVKNIFLEKRKKTGSIQLMWNDKSNCKIVYISTDKNGNQAVEKEELIRWDF